MLRSSSRAATERSFMAGQSGAPTVGSNSPMNVEQIVEKAQNFDYNPLIPLKYWLRTAGTLLKEAEIYEHEGNDQQTYLLLFRHAQLVIGCLSKHPDIRIAENRAAFVLAEQAVQSSLSKLEILKPRINKRHERYVQLIRERNNRRALSHGSKPKPSLGILENALDPEQRVPDPAVAGAAETLAADDHKELAVKLAHQELKRRALARKATRQAGIPEEVEQERRSAGLWGNWEEAYIQDDKAIDQDTLSRQMQNVRVQVEATKRGRPRDNRQQPNPEGSLSTYHYPAIPGRNAHESWLANSDSPSPSSPSPPPTSSHDVPQYSKPPELPPKLEMTTTSHNGPSNPRKSPSPLENLAQLQASKSPLPKSLTPATFVFKPSAYLENGSPLRTIFLPPDLRKSFLAYAEANTRANLETCGILCGTLISNALFISKLVIPDQESTSDTCETINEGELFDYVDGEDLMVLGWIHTHPTQTCFLSSRDVHTHCGYQVMMPESIAIVCAPSKGEWGVFRLTDPPGMKVILSCTQTGLFHPHAVSNIYTDALRPGHVHEAKGLEFEVVDLRPNRVQ